MKLPPLPVDFPTSATTQVGVASFYPAASVSATAVDGATPTSGAFLLTMQTLLLQLKEASPKIDSCPTPLKRFRSLSNGFAHPGRCFGRSKPLLGSQLPHCWWFEWQCCSPPRWLQSFSMSLALLRMMLDTWVRWGGLFLQSDAKEYCCSVHATISGLNIENVSSTVAHPRTKGMRGYGMWTPAYYPSFWGMLHSISDSFPCLGISKWVFKLGFESLKISCTAAEDFECGGQNTLEIVKDLSPELYLRNFWISA